ncbi:MAG: membrane integrity-associated transporter subunit PqiC [Deltaproteobacteria bacterium]|nr:MAG: membrane integrity-associated transporter subunit PqiC [Deltaproteobacteria bacterium]
MRAVPLLCALLLVACASDPPARTHYLLRAELPDATRQIEAPAAIGLGRVTVAPYLLRPGLVIESDDHQVRPARYHVWAEPLDEGLRRYLRTEISNVLGYAIRADWSQRSEWDYAVDVVIDQLHGTLSGEARLAAGWRIARADGREIAAYVLSSSEPLAVGGYQGLVDAEIVLLQKLAARIAESLQEAVATD